MKGSAAKPMWYIRKIFGDGMFEWMISRAFGGSRRQKKINKPEVLCEVAEKAKPKEV